MVQFKLMIDFWQRYIVPYDYFDSVYCSKHIQRVYNFDSFKNINRARSNPLDTINGEMKMCTPLWHLGTRWHTGLSKWWWDDRALILPT